MLTKSNFQNGDSGDKKKTTMNTEVTKEDVQGTRKRLFSDNTEKKREDFSEDQKIEDVIEEEENSSGNISLTDIDIQPSKIFSGESIGRNPFEHSFIEIKGGEAEERPRILLDMPILSSLGPNDQSSLGFDETSPHRINFFTQHPQSSLNTVATPAHAETAQK